jgi:predicted lipoprotein
MKLVKLISFSAVILFVGITGCKSKDDQGGSSQDFDRKAMLTNLSNNMIQVNYENLKENVNKTKQKALDFTNQPTIQSLNSLRESLNNSQLAYQGCSSFEFGPAMDHSLRSIMNTYPTSVNIVEANIVSGNYDLFSAANIAAKGLPAVEYLIYGTQMSDQNIIDAFSTGTNWVQRRTYLNDVINQLNVAVTNVSNAWGNTGYHQLFVNADGIAVGSSTSLLINSMVLDFEKYIRDGKVGIPVGVRSLGTPNPNKVEAYYSKKSLELLKESLLRYKSVFNGIDKSGANGLGLDDYLSHTGGGSISQNINKQLDEALQKLNELSGPLSQDVVNNKEKVKNVYTELQKTIVLLKVEMPSALSVLITYQDSDGD